MRRLRLFISSPGDVATERGLLRRVVSRIQARLKDCARLETIFWEDETYRSSAGFQDQIVRPSSTDVVLCILWSRFGTPLPDRYHRADGSLFSSGTEYEFEDALAGQRERGTPELLVYRKTAETAYSRADLDDAEELTLQCRRLDAFVARWFEGPGSEGLAYNRFESADEFEDRVERDLSALLDAKLSSSASDAGELRPWWQGSPFRGLEPFEAVHSSIFFGRTRATDEILQALRRKAADREAFVLIVGMSGCGKSSLVRAGVLPLLVEPDVVTGTGPWRSAVVIPSANGDPFESLAEALTQDGAFPELGRTAERVGEIAGLLRSGPAASVALIEGALASTGAPSGRSRPSLALFIDQLETFLLTDGLEEELASFGEVVAGLARAGSTWVLSTLRSDCYDLLARMPALVDLKSGDGQFDLLPPSPHEIGQMIRHPALAAGLRFETHHKSGERLDDALRDAAVADPEALPLLQFTLEELHRGHSAATLTWEAYERLGGIGGAIASRAEQVVAALTPPEHAAVPGVFQGLVAIGPEDRAIRKAAPLEALTASPERRAVVDALLESRLLVSDRDPRGDPVVTLAHDALFHRWPRLSAWSEENRETLRIRHRVDVARQRWESEGRPSDLLLPAGKPLEEGCLLFDDAGGPDTAVRDYVHASVRRERTRRRLKRAAACLLIVLTAVSTGLAIVALDANRNETASAKESRDRADEARQRTAELLVERARIQWLDGLPTEALDDLIEAENLGAEGLVYRYLRNRCESVVARRIATLPTRSPAAVSPTEPLFVLFDDDGIGEIRHLDDGRVLGRLDGHFGTVTAVAFSADGKTLVTGDANGLALIWNVPERKIEHLVATHDRSSVEDVACRGDHILVSGFGETSVWSRSTGRLVWASPDSPVLLFGQGSIAVERRGLSHVLTPIDRGASVMRILDTPVRPCVPVGTHGLSWWMSSKVWSYPEIPPTPLESPPQFSAAAATLAIKPLQYQRVVAVGLSDGRCVTNVRSRSPTGNAATSLVLVHRDAVTLARWSRDGRTLLTASRDRSAKVWNTDLSVLLTAMSRHGGAVDSAALGFGARRAVTTSAGRASLWALGPERVKDYDGTIALSADGRLALRSGGAVIETSSGSVRSKLDGLAASLRLSSSSDANFSKDGRHLLLYPEGVWDLRNGKRSFSFRPTTMSGWMKNTGDRFSPDGKHVAVITPDHRLEIYAVPSGTCVLDHPLESSCLVRFLDERSRVAVLTNDHLRCWDLRNGTLCLEREVSHRGAVFREGNVVLGGVGLGGVGLLSVNLVTGEAAKLEAEGAVRILGSAGRTLLTQRTRTRSQGRTTTTLVLRDAVSGEVLTTIAEGSTRGLPTSAQVPLAFGANGLRLALVLDGTVKLFETRSGAPLAHWSARGSVSALALSHDGSLVATAEAERLRIWAAGGELIDTIEDDFAVPPRLVFGEDGAALLVLTRGRLRSIDIRTRRVDPIAIPGTRLTPGAADVGFNTRPAGVSRRERLTSLLNRYRSAEREAPRRLAAFATLDLRRSDPDVIEEVRDLVLTGPWRTKDPAIRLRFARRVANTLVGTNRARASKFLGEVLEQFDTEEKKRLVLFHGPSILMDLAWTTLRGAQLARKPERVESLQRAGLQCLLDYREKTEGIRRLRELLRAHEHLQGEEADWWRNEYGPAVVADLERKIDELETPLRDP